MKTGRRIDSRPKNRGMTGSLASVRRISVEDSRRVEDRDFPMGRYRKRPSMLSEFHGKHYNARGLDRDGTDGSYFRTHNRYGYEPPSTVEYDRYGPGFHKSKIMDPRRHPYANYYSRSAYHRHQPNAQYHNDVSNDYSHDEEVPPKRPRLFVDVSHQASSQFDTPNSADSVASSSNLGSVISTGAQNMESSPPPQVTGLSAYLEDIDSDDDILREEEDEKPQAKSPMEPPSASPGKPTKDELLQMMERVDRDIAANEGQMAILQKKLADLEESAKAPPPVSPLPPTTPSPKWPFPGLSLSDTEEGTPEPIPLEEKHPSPKRSLVETIYADNKLKARSAQAVLNSLNFPPAPAHSVRPLYRQPTETPYYLDIIERHRVFRPRLVECIRKRKLARHKKELQLCEQYDAHMAEWERKIDKIESSGKKKSRDAKNRELFEKMFPELKTRREQQERFTRVDQRGYVRSDAELKELMYELYEAPFRYQRTRATIPPMVFDKTEERVRFHSTNGLITDPMALYRESKFTNIWTDEEKRVFKEKYLMYPKNFEMIASFLPNKSTSDCVKYYYLSKKNENFKQLVRKVTIKRRNPPSAYRIPPIPLLTSHPSLLLGEKPKLETLPVPEVAESPSGEEEKPKVPDCGEWTEEEIASLKEGLRKYGRAWGKIYREVGGQKTATQCKQFYDDFCSDEVLNLNQALLEHSSIKSAEKINRRARKPVPAITAEVKPKKSKNKASPLNDGMDSENTDSASETECSANESETESTLTDSSHEDATSQHPHQSTRGSKKVPGTNLVQRRTSEEALELVIIAAEALNKIVPLEVALHDHTYARPPNSLVNNVDLQGTSGLSLIAAAAAVVSPTLSRNAGSGKLPVLSPVRAPRGRPPNSQKRGSSSSNSKLSPTLLSPAGSCTSVLLTDVKTPTLRGRTRSAPTDRPRSSTFQFPRTSTLARISMSSGNRSVGSNLRGIIPPASHMRQKDSTSGTSLKSMIASQPQPASGGSNTRFEALVNVAVAASPAELPETPTNNTPTPSTVTFPSLPLQTSSAPASNISSHSTPATPQSGTPSKDGGTSTAILDVNQAINILAWASLAGQQAPSTGTTQLSAQPLFAQAPMLQASNLLGSLVSQSSSAAVVQDTNETDTASPSQVAPTLLGSAPTVDTLLGQLAAASDSTVASRAEMPTTAGANSSEGNSSVTSSVTSSLTQQSPTQPLSLSHPASTDDSASSSSYQVRTTSSSDDLSNLNLLSSLVAVLAGSHPTSSSDSSSTPVTCTGGGNVHTAPTTLAAGFRPQRSNLEPVTTSASSLRVQDKTIPTRSHISAALSSERLLERSTVSSSEGREVDRTTNEDLCELPKPSHKNDSHKSMLHLSPEHSGEELPASVVRTSMTALAQGSPLKSQHHSFDTPSTLNMVRPTTHVHNSTNDITASLASIIPNPLSYPSISQQSTLLLYTRSLSFPLSASSEPSPEDDEEDHLESATRGISELSKLLGTDNGTDTTTTSRESSRYKSMSPWNPNDSLAHPSSLPLSSRTSYSGSTSNPSSFHKTDFGAETSSKSFLSNLLESHGSVHHTPSPRLGNTNNNNCNMNSNSPLFNHDNST